MGAEIDPGMGLTPFPSSILDETRFEGLLVAKNVIFCQNGHFNQN